MADDDPYRTPRAVPKDPPAAKPSNPLALLWSVPFCFALWFGASPRSCWNARDKVPADSIGHDVRMALASFGFALAAVIVVHVIAACNRAGAKYFEDE